MFKKHPKQKGFTLIELLMVMFIIGVTLSWMTINYHGKHKSRGSSEILYRLGYQFSLAKQEAIVNQRKIVFNLKKNEYNFEFSDSGRIVLSEKINDDLIIKVETLEKDKLITLYPNGEITSFRLILDDQGIYVSASGKIEYENNSKKNN